ncbi:heterodisulfide reductase-related iron-sulfur binding cluster [Streptomyces sp. Z26]|uniref:(Fe-S)-binding protein n=1 Tax=Streptomyces sp. Z26 TaxID=2500177 RepID=UPI000EF16160|nr:heterodisulfide reductase-related iron-sulfur binding cluster [Streptomyces sp. Z26]RLL67706.1 4Fe-4S dicluster domain-containing protein [Streptomyces sp. Z26]
MQLTAIIVSLVLAAVGVALFARAIAQIYHAVKLGQPVPAGTRTDEPAQRTLTLAREFLGHTRMNRWGIVGFAHWFVAVGFLTLVLTLVNAFGQLFQADWVLPVIGAWTPYEMFIEFIGLMTALGILTLIVIRQLSSPTRAGRKSRFTGSKTGQAYFVEAVILVIGVCILTLRGLEGALHHVEGYEAAYFITYPLVTLFDGMSTNALQNTVYLVAMVKIGTSFVWMIVVGLNTNMGVAWHRFLAFPNIWFKREATGGTALGELQPMTSGGKPIDFETVFDDEGGEETQFGVSQVEHFSWKGLLDFSTCTECGRCQSQCPAWNTGKPLSPKLLVMSLRDHAHAKAPYLLAGGGKDAEGAEKATAEQLRDVPATALAEAERPLIGTADDGPGALGGVIDPDVLWSCTTCGACVEQCPVDIEHVDHIVDMRRYQVMIESAFPSEAGTMLKNLEKKGNPWGLAKKQRLEWTKELEKETGFAVPVVGKTVEDLTEVEYLYWVGCAGALEDRAKKTTKAFAELLHIAGVSFAIMGGDEKCTGDSARRLGNEFLFQQLGEENVATLNAAFGEDDGDDGEGATRLPAAKKKIVATCPHCFNTIANEYPQLGGHYEVVHHTQLLQHLVDEGKLVPVTPVEGLITYHDPCYLGRHNKVYTPPREIISRVPGLRNEEMHRHKERGFCCGAGGARMWMEERIGKRINNERVDEALSLNPDIVSTACPFCLVMLTDSVNGKKAAEDGRAKENLQVVDVAQLLLDSVRTPEVEAEAVEPEPEQVVEAEPKAVAAEPKAEPKPEAKAAEPEPKAKPVTTEAAPEEAPAKPEAEKAEAEPAEPRAEAEAEPEAAPDTAEATEPEAAKADDATAEDSEQDSGEGPSKPAQ